MRILMLGWEFPPFISGGLGTACYGLTRALDRLGHEVLFVLPRAIDAETTSHVELISPERGAPDAGESATPATEGGAEGGPGVEYRMSEFQRVSFLGVPSAVRSPYAAPSGEKGERSLAEINEVRVRTEQEAQALREAGVQVPDDWHTQGGARPVASGHYAGDVVDAAQQYARMVVRLCRRKQFDVIHAHDWMTYPAGMALARITGKPLVAHIHSTEFDRSGEHVNQAVYDIERRGMHAAVRVAAVSQLTKNIVVQRYGVEAIKIEVVYNGIETNGGPPPGLAIGPKDKIVLFLGRITMQKGPEYFMAAAKKVLEKMDNVKFLVAGSGDMARRMIEQGAQLGIGHKVLFTGFLRGKDVERIFQMADLYVMPSVSEPFGIAPLEAISQGTPALISKQSGVSEVLSHALKVDFWDVDEMANKIIAILKHPPLSQTLRAHGEMELRKLTWEGAARKCVEAYQQAVDAVQGAPAPLFAG